MWGIFWGLRVCGVLCTIAPNIEEDCLFLLGMDLTSGISPY